MVDTITTSVQSVLDAIALSIQPFGELGPAGCLGTFGFAIKTIVYALAAAVESVVDAISASVEPVVDTVTHIGRRLKGRKRRY